MTETPTLEFAVAGMTCDGCARAVTKIITRRDDQARVVVDLASGRVRAVTNADPDQIVAALTAAGYAATPAG